MASKTKGVQIPIEVTVARVERQLAKIVKKVGKDAGTIQNSFETSNKAVGRSFERVGKQAEVAGSKVVRTQKRSGFAVANLSAQINDVGVSLAGGQSPFQVMIQQGTQISQIFQQTGSNAKDFFALLRSSIAGVINPFTLATFAIIGLGGAFVQWLTKTEEGSEKTKKKVDELQQAITRYATAASEASQDTSKLVDKYGEMTVEARKLLDIQHQLAKIDAFKAVKASLDGIITDKMDAAITRLKSAGRFGEVTDGYIQRLAKSFNLAGDEVLRLVNNIETIRSDGAIEDQIVAMSSLRELFVSANGEIENMTPAQREFYDALVESERKAVELVAVAQDVSPAFAAAVSQANLLGDAINRAVTGARSLAALALADLKSSEIGLSFKGDAAGKAAAEAAFKFDQKTGDTSGFDPVIRQKLEEQKKAFVETARATAVNTKALKDWEHAQKFAADAWQRFERISTRAKTAGEKELARQAKAEAREAKRAEKAAERKLKRDAAERKRAAAEAARISKRAAKPGNDFDKDIERSRARIKTMEAEAEIYRTLNPTLEDYGQALAAAKAEQHLLNEAEKAGVALGPTRLALIRQVAQETGAATAEVNRQRAAYNLTKKQATDFHNSAKSGLRSVISDIRAGTSEVKILENAFVRLADKMVELFTDDLFSGKDSLGGFLGQLGKLFGVGGGTTFGTVPFGTAPGLYSEGGYTGNGAKHEEAGTVHKGEYVLPAHVTRKVGVKNLDKLRKGYADGGSVGGGRSSSGSAFGPPQLNVHIENKNADQSKASASVDPATGMLKIVVDAVKKDYGSGGFDSLNKGRFGVGKQRTKR